MIVDTHAHLDFDDFNDDRDDVVVRAKSCGVSHILNVGTSIETSQKSIMLAEKYDGVYAAAGVHPHDASVVDHAYAVAEIERMCQHEKVVAIGGNWT